MGKFKTQDEVIAEFKKAHGNRYDYSKVEYIANKEKVIIICTKHGEFLQRVDAHKKGQGCKECQYDKKRLSFEDCKKELSNISPMIQILSTDYKNTDQKIKCKCLLDGYIWYSTWSRLKRGHGCAKCDGSARLTLEEVKNKLIEINANIKIISDNYVNSKTHLECECTVDGHRWNSSWDNLSQGKGCPRCSNVYVPTIEEVKEKMHYINKNIIIQSNKYTNNRTKLSVLCLLCNHNWSVCWSHLSQRRGCPECARLNNSGVYNITIADRNINEFKNKNATVYLVMLHNNDETFYKIGITVESTETRFSKGDIKYSYKCIGNINTNLYDAIYLENKLHELNKEFSYTPKIKFGGYTECFSEIKIFEKIL